VALMPSFYVPNEARVELNGPVLLFCLVVSFLAGIIFGLAPAFHLSRPDLTEALKDSARGSGTSARGARTRELLVVAEVALSVVLLVSAGLTVRSFIALQQVDLGFQPDRVVLMELPLTSKRYATLEQRNRFARELLERVQNLAGVQAAALGGDGVLFGGPDSTFAIDGPPGPETRRINLDLASPDLLRTAGIPLKRGRMFDDREVNAAAPVVLINEAALGLWPAGEDPIGKRLRLDLLEKPWGKDVLAPGGGSPYVTVIGVFGDTRNDGRAKATQPAAMVPYTLLAPPQRILAIRTLGNPELLITPLRAQATGMDKEQPLGRHITARELLGFDTVQPRFVMALFSLFATLGLALAMAGIYSVLSYLVTQRTQEIGVRMALGARREDVLGLIFKIGGRLVIVGMVIGVGAGLGVARLMRSQLYQVTAFDPVSFLGVVVLLTSVAIAACYIPARRATKVDPMVALRYE
jgi:putative ABC transport system permease protein